ncbi:unnamed protein product, partial [Mesorhabditis belari]|uniref:Ion transport domain-containing protein n=1 Tax=Mesorhabditis belari TaxID=2138241 RepID=A0AAF3FG08_9BILA
MSINVRHENDESALHLAVKSGQREVVSQLLTDESLNAQDSQKNTALHLAAEKGYTSICRDLMEKGADTTLVNQDSKSAFELAVQEGHLDCVALFCERCDINNPFLFGLTPLHLAVKLGHENIVGHLLAKGAKVELMTHGMWPRNAFEMALDDGNVSMAKLLLEAKNWEKMFRCKVQNQSETLQNLPMRRILVDYPDLARQVMDKCIKRNRNRVALEYNFDLVDDTFEFLRQDDYPLPFKRSQSDIYSKHPLRILGNSKCKETRKLLEHELVAQFIKARKRQLKRHEPLFYSTSFELFLFMFFLFSYLLIFVVDGQWKQEKKAYFLESLKFGDFQLKVFERRNATETPEARSDFNRTMLNLFVMSSLVSALLLLFVEVVKMLRFELGDWKAGPRELTEIFLQLLVSCISLFTIVWKGVDELCYWFDWEWSWNPSDYQLFWICSALAICLACWNFLFLLAKKKYFNLFVLMFMNVVKKFGGSFHLLLQDKEDFSQPHYSLFKTLVMGTGEMDYSDLFHGHGAENERPWLTTTAYCLYAIFVLSIVLIAMNLLTALAIGEIQDIQNDARQRGIAIEINTILLSCRFLPTDKLKEISCCRWPLRSPKVPKKLFIAPTHDETLMMNHQMILRLESMLERTEARIETLTEKVDLLMRKCDS